MRNRWWMLCCAMVVAVALARVAMTWRTFAPVVDEPVHIAAGYEWWHGNTGFDPPHPPLARILAALPLRNLAPPATHDLTGRGVALLESGNDLLPHLVRARAGNLLFLAIALGCTIAWGARFGPNVALLAAAMLASMPPILGHAGVATTDMAVAATLPLALLAFDRWLREPTTIHSLLLGGALGLGALSKFSFLLFFPVCALVLIVIRRLRVRLRGFAIAVGVAVLVVYAGYRGNLHDFVQGMRVVQLHNEYGHDSYLFGSVRRFGWWYYFPVVFFFKTPLPFLLLATIGTFAIATKPRDALDLALIPFALMLSVLPSNINIGVRHILPIYPPLCVVAAIGAVELWKRTRIVTLVACAWLFVGVALAHPDYLAWFNEAAGSHPERIAVDSNLDWGQDALRLRRLVRERHIGEIFLYCYHAVPIDHGMNLEPSRPAHGWVAVGETLLHVDPYARAGAYDWLKAYEPVERVGRSIRLYHIP